MRIALKILKTWYTPACPGTGCRWWWALPPPPPSSWGWTWEPSYGQRMMDCRKSSYGRCLLSNENRGRLGSSWLGTIWPLENFFFQENKKLSLSFMSSLGHSTWPHLTFNSGQLKRFHWFVEQRLLCWNQRLFHFPNAKILLQKSSGEKKTRYMRGAAWNYESWPFALCIHLLATNYEFHQNSTQWFHRYITSKQVLPLDRDL